MGALLVFLVVGAIIATVSSMMREESGTEFAMRFIFIEALQVLWWFLFIGKDIL